MMYIEAERPLTTANVREHPFSKNAATMRFFGFLHNAYIRVE